MQAAEQTSAQSSPQPKRRYVPVGKKWVKGQSGNPSGKPKNPSDTKRLMRMCERRARQILKREDAPAASVMAAIAFLERQALRRSAPVRETRNAADVLSRIASEHRPAVDQAEKINADEPADKR